LPVKGGYLLAAGGGALLLWSGIKGHRWSTVLRDLVSGKQVPSTQELAIQTSAAAYGYGTSTVASSNFSATGITSVKNKAIGATIATTYGWGPGTSNWTSLVKLWNGESGWSNTAQNPDSTAYGIAQFLDTTWASYGSKTSNSGLQISYGLKYIKQRYGNPDNAYNAWLSRSPHWY
jgi:sulfite reductase alpha subunit-like flavoprotein